MKNKLLLYFLIGIISIPTYSQCLSGDCYNGTSSYRFPNGDIYTGNYESGFRNGYGVYKFRNGDVYTGYFVNGILDGYGEYEFVSGEVQKGNWKNGNLVESIDRKGFVKEINNKYTDNDSKPDTKYNPELVSNSYSNNNVINQQDGCISGDCNYGFGIYNFSNGDTYKGDYLNGYRTGKGLYIWSNGNQYEGDFLNNKHQGSGVFRWSDGDIYEGDFVNNIIQGYGIYYFNNGDKYQGDWVSGVKQGQGKYTYASGIIKEGKWSNNIFISSNINNYNVAQGNSSYSGSGSTNNNNSQLSTNPMEDFQNGFKELVNNPLIKGMLAKEVKLSNSGVNVNGEKCKKCKIVLKTPKNRACYICNRQFSGWGFIKESYGITLEHEESISSCFPEIGAHNYKCWRIHEDACCSRQCAMKL